MKIYLQSFEEFDTVLELNSITQKHLIIKRKEIDTTCGFFSDYNTNVVGILCFKNAIWLYYNNLMNKYNDNMKIEYIRNNNLARLSISDSQNEFIIRYLVDSPLSTLTYSEEDEDSDFGLWLSNILNSKERRLIFLINNSTL